MNMSGIGVSGATDRIACSGKLAHGFRSMGCQQRNARRPEERRFRAEVRERRRRILEEHHAEAGKQRIVRLLQQDVLRVRQHHLDVRVATGGDPRACQVDERGGDVDPGHPAACANPLGELQQRLSGATADVEDSLAWV